MRFEDQRLRLILELRKFGIQDENILRAFNNVPRENFVLPEYTDYAYRNQPLPIDLNQTISQPLMIAIMLEHLDLIESDIVLEIGTGSGYQAALLSTLVREVCTIERLEALSLKARATLHKLGYDNIYYKIGNGVQGWQKAFPTYTEFSKIIVSAATDQIPDKLMKQLSDPGIMVIPIGESNFQELIKITKKDGNVQRSIHGGCSFVPLVSDYE
jgi:protein-L-isoaspartate(D-aspartate) O-methyltransferase